ncbi:hypothetical protein Vi05172_g2086 [Venturia inaequalis]|nr:hypothetical protein Vi05172_g2086 [Venturia inaequalis]
MSSTMPVYQQLSADKKLQQSSQIPKDWLIPPMQHENLTNLMGISLNLTRGLLNDVEYSITSDYDATALLEKLKAGFWSAEQVNCLTEIFFNEAILRARHLDNERKENPQKPLPLLWGLPISLKDCFDIAGFDTSTGLGCYINDPAKENCPLAVLLLDLGAVLYCKTNLPQSIMTADSDNNIFGRTLNPWNTRLTAGGSTGGEGALLALRGSIMGVGTDIAGSIRIPALCNAIYGFRTSVGLIPYSGVRDLTTTATDGIRCVAGPMTTSIRDCSLFVKAVMEAETWRYDSDVVSVPWRNLKVKKKLRIGVVENDGLFTPTPPVRRGLTKATDLLKGREDIEVIPLTLPDMTQIYKDIFSYATLLGPDCYLSKFAQTGEPVIPSLANMGLLTLQGTDLKGFFALNARRAQAAQIYHHFFLSNNLDAIMMPPAPHTAVPLDTWASASYTGLWNYLDYPATVIPVDTVRESDIVDDVSHAQFGAEDEKFYAFYTGPEEYKDAPVAVQLVGYKQADEALLSVAVMVDSIINGTN